jgi:ferredoxin
VNRVGEPAGKIPVIETNACLGCGVCVDLCPEVFSLIESLGIAVVVNPDGCPRDRIEEAMASCPAHCLNWD